MRSYSGFVADALSLEVHSLTSPTSKWFLQKGIGLW